MAQLWTTCESTDLQQGIQVNVVQELKAEEYRCTMEARLDNLEKVAEEQTRGLSAALERLLDLKGAVSTFADSEAHVGRRLKDLDVKVESLKDATGKRLDDFELLLLAGSTEIEKCLHTVQAEHERARSKLEATTVAFVTHMRSTEGCFEHLMNKVEEATRVTVITNDLDERLRKVGEATGVAAKDGAQWALHKGCQHLQSHEQDLLHWVEELLPEQLCHLLHWVAFSNQPCLSYCHPNRFFPM